jgi:hypothetical protein
MKFLTNSECERWCVERGLQTPGELRRSPVLSEYVSYDFSIPEDAGARVALCRSLWSLPVEERLLWVDEWSVWPSGEHLPLFTKWRAAFGENRALIDARGHVVEPSEDDDGLSVLVMAALFLWDCWIYIGNGAVVMISHDECGSVWQRRDVRQSTDWKDILRKFGVLAP